MTVSVTEKVRKVKKHERNSRIFSLLSSSRYSLKVGMKATAMEPSAKRRLKRLGIRKATENASESALVPKRLALVISRKRPRMRDAKVSSESLDPWRNKALELSVCCWFSNLFYLPGLDPISVKLRPHWYRSPLSGLVIFSDA